MDDTGKRRSVKSKLESKAAAPGSSARMRKTKRDTASLGTADRTGSTGRVKASKRAGNTGRIEGGRRAGDIRAQQRAKRQRSQYRRFIGRIVIVITIILVIIFGSIFVYRSDLFHVNNVQVNGVSHLTSQEITSIAAISDDSTLLRLDVSGICSRLEDNAWIQDASVHRVFPDTVVIDVTERAPCAVVKVNDKSTWVISADATWLSAATTDDWENAMKIIDVSPSMPAPISGSACTDGGIINALDILDAVSDNLRSRIVSISAESSIKTSLNLADGVTVAFGDSSDVELKEAAINSLLNQYGGKISYINVRVPSRPTYRMLDEETGGGEEGYE